MAMTGFFPCQALPPRGIWLGALAWASALLLPLLLAVLLGFLLREGAGALNLALFFGDTPPMAAIFRAAPDFDGIWPACLGTLCLVALATAMAVWQPKDWKVALSMTRRPFSSRNLIHIRSMSPQSPLPAATAQGTRYTDALVMQLNALLDGERR